MVKSRTTKLLPEMLRLLAASTVNGNYLKLPADGEQPRPLHLDGGLRLLGGRWSKKEKAYCFDGPDCDLAGCIDGALSTGEFRDIPVRIQFITPPSLADFAASFAEIESGHTVLEPSAGTGNLAYAADAVGGEVLCIDSDPVMVKNLKADGYTVKLGDFFGLTTSLPLFDRVLMFPPFGMGVELRHVVTAYDKLKPGGILVAILPVGFTFRQDESTREFKQLLSRYGESTENDADTFRGTGVPLRTVTIKLRRPE